jgi:hypothetical protein
MTRCAKCSGFILQRINYSHEGLFSERYCLNCGLRLDPKNREDFISRRKMSRPAVIVVEKVVPPQIQI